MLLAFCCAAVAYGQLGRYSLDFSLSEKNFVDTIAIEYENNQVYVPVNVGGRQMRFLLDTGAAQAIVYADTDLAQSPSRGSVRSISAFSASARGSSTEASR